MNVAPNLYDFKFFLQNRKDILKKVFVYSLKVNEV